MSARISLPTARKSTAKGKIGKAKAKAKCEGASTHKFCKTCGIPTRLPLCDGSCEECDRINKTVKFVKYQAPRIGRTKICEACGCPTNAPLSADGMCEECKPPPPRPKAPSCDVCDMPMHVVHWKMAWCRRCCCEREGCGKRKLELGAPCPSCSGLKL